MGKRKINLGVIKGGIKKGVKHTVKTGVDVGLDMVKTGAKVAIGGAAMKVGATVGAIAGGAIGGVVGGPPGAAAGATVGSVVGAYGGIKTAQYAENKVFGKRHIDTTEGIIGVTNAGKKFGNAIVDAAQKNFALMKMLHHVNMNKEKILFHGITTGQWTYPGSNYIGPGNPNNSGEPVNAQDALAYQHDHQYSELQEQGVNPYFTFNEADRELYEKADLKTPEGWALKLGMGVKKLTQKEDHHKVGHVKPWKEKYGKKERKHSGGTGSTTTPGRQRGMMMTQKTASWGAALSAQRLMTSNISRPSLPMPITYTRAPRI
jgi:hypothetical protein